MLYRCGYRLFNCLVFTDKQQESGMYAHINNPTHVHIALEEIRRMTGNRHITVLVVED